MECMTSGTPFNQSIECPLVPCQSLTPLSKALPVSNLHALSPSTDAGGLATTFPLTLQPQPQLLLPHRLDTRLQWPHIGPLQIPVQVIITKESKSAIRTIFFMVSPIPVPLSTYLKVREWRHQIVQLPGGRRRMMRWLWTAAVRVVVPVCHQRLVDLTSYDYTSKGSMS